MNDRCIVCNKITDNTRFCDKKCYDRDRYINKKIHIAAVQKEYYLKNKEKIDNKNRLWFENNREADRLRAKQYYKDNRKSCITKSIEYRNDRKGTKWYNNLILKCNFNRRANKANIVELFLIEEWINMKTSTNGICPKCENYVGLNKITLDHIYPISKAEEGRTYTINDIQPLCKSCNSSKGVEVFEN